MRNTLLATLCCLTWTMNMASFCMEECKAPGIGVPDSMVQKLVKAVKAGECSLYDSLLWPKDYAEEVLRDGGVEKVFDFVVVGAGSAGSVVASRLSENSNIKVLVLEAGGDPPKESEMSLMYSLFHTNYTWNDYSIPWTNCCQGVIGERCYWPHGKMIGGSGGANGNVFLTGNRENYDGWQHAGNPGWSWEDVIQYFTKAEEQKGNASHPIGGLMLNYIKNLPEHQPLTDVMYQAAEEIGLPIVKNFGEGSDIGITTNIWKTKEKGRRMSTGKTYLAKVAHKRPNLKVIKNAYVTKIRFNQYNCVVGVEFMLQGKFKFSVNVSKEVILSAGALRSPKILMHSGVGPKDHLKSLGIPLHKHLQVGENLHDHGVLLIFFRIKRGSLTTFDERAEYQNILNYFLYSEGALANEHTLFAYINSKTNSTSPYPDMQIITPFSFLVNSSLVEQAYGLKRDIFQSIQSIAGTHEMVVFRNCLMKPQTRGRLRLRSTDVFEAPYIEYQYGKHAADKAAVLRIVRYLQGMQNTKAFKAYDMEIIQPSLPKCTVGTCKMGPKTDADAVVDARLRVHGVRGVRVIDASIMPTITSSNTNAPTIMIGEKGAAMVIEDLK